MGRQPLSEQRRFRTSSNEDVLPQYWDKIYG